MQTGFLLVVITIGVLIGFVILGALLPSGQQSQPVAAVSAKNPPHAVPVESPQLASPTPAISPPVTLQTATPPASKTSAAAQPGVVSYKIDYLTTLKGNTYRNVTVVRVDPDGLRVTHADGTGKIPFTELPAEIQSRYSYDPKKAEEFKRSQVEAAQKSQEATTEDARVRNSPWDGSVYQVKDWLKKNANDPQSIDYMEWTEVSKTTSGYAVRCKFRMRNGFGGMVIQNKFFLLDESGNVVDVKDF